MFKFHICLKLLGLSLTLLSAKLFANDIFEYQGGFNRAFGGAGAIMSRGGESVLQNPANLWVNTKSDMYADIGFFHLGYSVTTPESNVKPGSIAVPAIPLPSIGATYKLGQWSLGGLFFPTGIGSKNKVSDFPVQLNGQYQSVDIDAAQKGFKIGLGLAYRISSNFSLGLSIIYDKFDTESNIKLTDSDSIHTRSSSKFIRPIIGLRYRWAALGSFAFSYQFKKAAPYSLEVQAFSEETQYFTRSTYRPTVYTLGALTRRIGSFRFFGQYSYEVWVPATFIAQAPNQALAGDVDVEFLNTHNFILGSRYAMAAGSQLSLSFSHFAKNKGPGLLSDKGELLLNGSGPQDFEGMNRNHLTLSYEASRKGMKWIYYGSFIRGTVINPEDAPNAGYYQLDIFLAGLSYVQNY